MVGGVPFSKLNLAEKKKKKSNGKEKLVWRHREAKGTEGHKDGRRYICFLPYKRPFKHNVASVLKGRSGNEKVKAKEH